LASFAKLHQQIGQPFSLCILEKATKPFVATADEPVPFLLSLLLQLAFLLVSVNDVHERCDRL
jgi:hypothetical protein